MNIPPDLVSQIRSGKCIVFVGHQLSEFAGLPSWKEMLFQMWDWSEKYSGPLSDRKELENLIPEGMVTAVSLTQKLLYPKRLFNKCMTEVYKSYYDLKPTDIHKLIARLPFASAFTTNYDTLLESAYSHIQGTSPPCYTYQDTSNVLESISKNQFCVLKLRGTIDQIDTIIFGQEKSANSLIDYSEFLQYILTSMTILFIGCNPSDPDQIMFLGEIYRNIIPALAEKHYAFVSDEEASNFRKQWSADRSINNYLRIIPYKHKDSNYEQIQQFLTELPERLTESQEAKVDGKVVITKSIENQENLEDDKFQSRVTVQRVEQMERECAATFRKESQSLLMTFDDLANSKDEQRRGYLLQDFLNQIFTLYEIPVINSFTRNEGGEQIDGAFKLEGWHYIVECRWRKELSDIRDLDGLCGQIGRSGKQTMGLFLSINGWSDNVPPLLKQNPGKVIFLMDGYDLRTALDRQIDLRDFLLAKIAELNLKAEPYYGVAQYMKKQQG